MEEKCYVKEAVSSHNGIAFHSQLCPGYYVIEQNEDEKITMNVVLESELDQSKMRKAYEEIPKHHILFITFFLSVSLLLTAITDNAAFFLGGIYFILRSYKELMDLIIYFIILHFTPYGRLNAQYHAAEHKVVNAYEKYQRLPTLKEIEKSSPFSGRCGSLLLINHIIIKFVYSIFFGLLPSCSRFISYWIILFVVTIFMFIAKKYEWFRFFEFLVVRKPTKKQLTLAMQGISYYHKTETEIKKLKDDPAFAKYFEKHLNKDK